MTKCLICGDVDHKIILGDYKGKSEIFKHKTILKCQKCGFVFIHPMPSDDSLSMYYRDEFLSDTEVHSSDEDALAVYRIQANERVKYLERMGVLKEEVSTVLDVGSGRGILYDSFVEKGYGDVDFYAAELNSENKRWLWKKDLTVLDYDEEGKLIVPCDVMFDLITFCFVLEHQTSPAEFIKGFAKHLSPGGLIYIDVPNRDDTFKNIHEAHTLFFNADSLRRLAGLLDLKVVGLESFGASRDDLIRENSRKAWIRNLVPFKARKKIHSLIKPDTSSHGGKKILYNQFKFDCVGLDRWWLRCILKKKD